MQPLLPTQHDADDNPALCEEIPALSAAATLDRAHGTHRAPVAAAGSAAGTAPALPGAAQVAGPAAARPDRGRLRRTRPVWQRRATSGDEAELPDHAGFDGGIDRRLLAALGLEVRERLRRAAVRARDGPLQPDAPRGRAAELDRLHPVPE